MKVPAVGEFKKMKMGPFQVLPLAGMETEPGLVGQRRKKKTEKTNKKMKMIPTVVQNSLTI